MSRSSPTPSHTPGPWSIREGYGMLKAEVGPDNRAVAAVWTKQLKSQKDDNRDRAEPWAEGQANARLIAAAPRMLAALRLAYPLLTDKAAREEIGALLREIE